MKTFFTFIIFTVLTSNSFAHALFAPLKEISISPDQYTSEFKIISGTILVDQIENKIVLTLDYIPECPSNAICYQGMLNVLVDLPIIASETDACNIKTYTARKEMRPVDGLLEQLTVIDYSNSTCYVPFSVATDTYIDYLTIDLMDNRATSRFTAGKLNIFTP